ncbi:YhdH/YhfP family quinone oxidoreductase [Mucilaginibacter sp. CSA2-8R]|uniref:YhdH/YhfP family quinone oxidoreductase n=1 Tax=Mucilaginibacter sp. CSA2-8R TaxID=3141542 RepID=UPI00315CCDD2
MEVNFDALWITEDNGTYKKEIKQLSTSQLPIGDLLIKVKYSSVNYKDALSASGNKGVTKKFPHVPGVDAAGIVMQSNTSAFAAGDEVIVTGFDLGMNTWGGFAGYIRIPADWAIRLPQGLSLQEAMAFGTAGLTAGLSVLEVVDAQIEATAGPVVVSGATGGVGSIAASILTTLGYQVVAVSGKTEDVFLTDILGVTEIMGRDEFIDAYDAKPITKPAFAAGIDTVSGRILSGMLKAAQYGGVVTCCGMVASPELQTSIFPFILRGVKLAGIDSVMAPLPVRQKVWQLLATGWKPHNLQKIVQEIDLPALPEVLEVLLHGQARGRHILKHAD